MLKKVCAVLAILAIFVASQAWAADVPAFLPKDAMLIMSANVAKIMEVPQLKEAFEKSKASSGGANNPKSYENFVKTFGFNPEKEVKQIVAVMPPTTPGGKPPEPTFVVVTGTFNEAKIIEMAQKSEEFKKESDLVKFEGLNAFKDKKSKENLIGVFVDAQTFVLGPEENVKKGLAIKNGKEKGIMDNAAFATLLKKIDNNTAVWGAAVFPPALKADIEKNAAGTPMALAAALDSFFFTINAGTDLDLGISLFSAKKEAVDGLFGAIDGSLAMLKTGSMVPLATDALNLVKLIQTKKGDDSIQLSWKVEIKKLEEAVKATMAGMMPPQMPPQMDAPLPAPANDDKESKDDDKDEADDGDDDKE
jgi:hypothetical protein